MIAILRSLHNDESGQDLIEYALLALLIALATIAILPGVGTAINTEFSRIGGALS